MSRHATLALAVAFAAVASLALTMAAAPAAASIGILFKGLSDIKFPPGCLPQAGWSQEQCQALNYKWWKLQCVPIKARPYLQQYQAEITAFTKAVSPIATWTGKGCPSKTGKPTGTGGCKVRRSLPVALRYAAK